MRSFLLVLLWATALVLTGCNSSFELKNPDQLIVDGDNDGFASTEDCDDDDPDISPGAEEVCGDGIDNDCDEATDESVSVFYADADGDGYGDADSTTEACEAPTGYVDNTDDCDDADFSISPDGVEVCGGVDEDCDGTVDEDGAYDALTWYADSDEDGFGDLEATTTACEQPSGYTDDSTDCDDGRDDVNPEANEVCDGSTDEDCDDTVDEDDADGTTTYYADADADGFGDEDATKDACSVPSGYVEDATDCDDDEEDVNPDATELCNGYDDDCDGDIDLDDDSLDTSTTSYWYLDDDGDGFGDSDYAEASCEQPYRNYVSNDEDCDDSRDDINPDADEYCDGTEDEDCDGTVDEDDAADAETFYADADEDGFGDEDTTHDACEVPSGYVDNSDDCDDGDEDINPDADEYCDGVDDEDCDGDVDEDGAVDGTTFYADDDGDGFGDDSSTYSACDTPTGYVSDNDDCDDSDSAVNPDADEICDDIDNDCDGDIDDDDASVDTSTGDTFYADDDGDGYGDASSTTMACEVPADYADNDDDCDDSDAGVSPDATEVCDGDDNDCDGDVDDDDASVDTSTGNTYYADDDGDGFGDSDNSTMACSQPSGYLLDSADCDDSDSAINPTATEVCDEVDNDCDGDIDDDDPTLDKSTGDTFYRDIDEDGFGGTSSTVTACDPPSGFVDNSDDCDDYDDAISPDGTEVCDGSDDEDCDGTVDEDGASDVVTWYIDSDSDGYGDNTTSDVDCDQPSGYVDNDDDCDDAESSINPDADEECDGSTDEDCDGSVDEAGAKGGTDYYADVDGDSYGDPDSVLSACTQPGGYQTNDDDCDDDDSAINPAATEACDGDDNDCDTSTDEGFTDSDSDGLANCVDYYVYEDDFSDTSPGDWSTFNLSGTGDWTHNGSRLIEDDGSALTFHYLPDMGSLTHYTISVDVQWKGNNNDTGGIVLGWDGVTNLSTTTGYTLLRWDDPQGDYSQWYGGSYAGLMLRECPSASCSTNDYSVINTVSTTTYSWSTAKELAIEVDGTDVDVYLDGSLEFSTTTSTHIDPDYIGLWSDDMDGGVRFDNYVLTNEDATP